MFKVIYRAIGQTTPVTVLVAVGPQDSDDDAKAYVCASDQNVADFVSVLRVPTGEVWRL